MRKARVIALYLPQFHPTDENDLWWGKGFTEWTNVAKARPLFKGHYQPHIPADLGFYDLRLSETREAQAKLAAQYGIEGFCYWHYWFGNGKKLLERPFEEVLKSRKPDFPFCLSWANHSWQKKLWDYDRKGDVMLQEQLYPGDKDIIEHFNYVLPAFLDHRYITVDGKPLFGIYAPLDYPDVSHFIEVWQILAQEHGLKGIYFVGQGNVRNHDIVLSKGFDAVNDNSVLEILNNVSLPKKIYLKLKARLFKHPIVFQYSDAAKYWHNSINRSLNTIPTIAPNWDHTPRSHNKGIVLNNSTPQAFKRQVLKTIDIISDKPEEYKLVFLKSWNEWGEGNYIEPDIQYGHQYLEALYDAIK